MIFVWGEKIRRKPLGVVADLCPTCREVRPHDFVEIRAVPHLYYIPFGRGKIASYEIECSQCQHSPVAETTRYAAMLDKEIPLEKLIELTNPGVLLEQEEMKDREERARTGQLSGDERVEVMLEALYPVTLQVEERVASRSVDKRTALLATATLGACSGLFVMGLTPDNPERGMMFLWASGAAAVLGVGAMIHSGITSLARFIRRTQGEAIRAAIGHFNPSPIELKEIATSLRASGTQLGKKLDVEWLIDVFHSVRAVSSAR